tara:strand:- start:929 stop:1456 length:528 start_codon:yes stop_codon:yes gene_type:complete
LENKYFKTKNISYILLALLFLISFLLIPQKIYSDDDGEDEIINGFISAIESTNENTILSITDNNGVIYDIIITSDTVLGLDNAVGERWIDRFSNDINESIKRLNDQQNMLSPITILHHSKYAHSITTKNSENLKTNLNYLFIVFALAWLSFFGYLIYLSRRLLNIKEEIKLLKSK